MMLLGHRGSGRRRRPAAGGASGDGGVDGVRLHLLHPLLFQAEVRSELGEAWVGDEAEVPRGIAEILVEPGGERAEEEVIIDLGADIAKLVSESLKAATIVVDGGVVLMTPKELLLQKNATLELVVGEEPVQFGPHSVGVTPSCTTV